MKEEKVKTQEYDILVLGDGIEYSSDCSKTNCNNNVVVIGGTGSGKTFSIVLKRLIQTMNSNLIVATVKDRLYDITANALTRRGYRFCASEKIHRVLQSLRNVSFMGRRYSILFRCSVFK